MSALGWGTGLAAAGAGAAWMAWAVRGRSSRVFGNSVWRGERPELALTFDDGPSESTPRLLELLEKHKVRATFFLCGKNVERCPEIARGIVRAGHEIGNHTHTHPRLDFRSSAFIFDEMEAAQAAIVQATGVAPRWFRAPYGVRWVGVGAAQDRLGLRGAMWTVIGSDWRLPAEAIAEKIERGAGPGAILCLHDGRAVRVNPDISSTLDAVALLLPRLKNKGLEFATLSEVCPKR